MNALIKSIATISFALTPLLATAQYEPSGYPMSLPENPRTFIGEYERQRAGRLFYEAWGTYYKLSKRQNRYATAEVRSATRQIRENERISRIEVKRQARQVTRIDRQEENARRALSLVESIRTGTVNWASALRTGWAGALIDEASEILSRDERSQGEGMRLFQISEALRNGIRDNRIGENQLQRIQALRFVTLLENIASNETGKLVTSIGVDKQY
jgi:hypothetical protein